MPYGGPWTPSEIPVAEFDDTESETSAHTTINQSATEKKKNTQKKKKEHTKKKKNQKKRSCDENRSIGFERDCQGSS